MGGNGGQAGSHYMGGYGRMDCCETEKEESVRTAGWKAGQVSGGSTARKGMGWTAAAATG